ncbi:hypothetical protein P3T35_001866 [Kitasatospora sp. GP30]|uniref:hypothetical protein n=1 Tax=Kitasatospora sp. GP30 TaxID=3035084 RepID=UPI000C7018E5|nr:hypothetical protein [Kitasatospora sp. GP30]MDH6139866.1 hypothetical protein [Kitasatospora sp. GP30]
MASAIFLAQGTMLLLTVPAWWSTALEWLRDRVPAWAYIAFVLAVGLSIVVAGAEGESYNMGTLAFGLALAMRSGASLTEPNVTAVEERQLLWRLRRAALIHAGFMPVFAFGVMVIVASIEHSGGQRVPFAWPAGVIVATTAFIFKVHQRVRKVCTLIADRVAQTQTALAVLETPASVASARKVIKDLDAALRTPVQTGYHLWGTPVVSQVGREQLIDWLNKRVSDQQPVLDSNDAEYQSLVTIADVCRRWTDIAA